ncbi:hypothetical protein LY76DRAFT_165418 [Colletotrichum caudatum]|nr:hypothetical protein LY76DRAFT_165418 [Colletotrichum caudatum]
MAMREKKAKQRCSRERGPRTGQEEREREREREREAGRGTSVDGRSARCREWRVGGGGGRNSRDGFNGREACNRNCAAMRAASLALDSAYTACPIGAERKLGMAAQRCHWAANPCQGLVRIRARLLVWDCDVRFWGGGELGGHGHGQAGRQAGRGGGEQTFCRQIDFDVVLSTVDRE